jgi:hypothetical protein
MWKEMIVTFVKAFSGRMNQNSDKACVLAYYPGLLNKGKF